MFKLLLILIIFIALIIFGIKAIIRSNINAAKEIIDKNLNEKEKKADVFRKNAKISWLNENRVCVTINPIGKLTNTVTGYLFKAENAAENQSDLIIFESEVNMTKEEVENRFRNDYDSYIDKEGMTSAERNKPFFYLKESWIRETKEIV